MPQDGHLGSDVLSLEATLWRLDAVRGEEATAARGREREAAQGGRRSHARQRDVAGGDPPQTMTPARGREMIDFVRAAFQVSIRRACRTGAVCGFSHRRGYMEQIGRA